MQHLQLEKYINLHDAKLIKQGKKPIKTKKGLSKILKADFPQSKHLYEQILRLEKTPFKERYNKALVTAIAKVLEVENELDLFVKEEEIGTSGS